MEVFQERVIAEKVELDDKRKKLCTFMTGSIFTALPEDERMRLAKQDILMKDYSDVLGERIAAFPPQLRCCDGRGCPVCTGKVPAVPIPPVDRTARTLNDGSPVPLDYSHTQLCSDGQQKGYVVLTKDERNKGFVRPFRDAYRHIKCGKITTMGRAIAETYARDPNFYDGTFCSSCRAHFPIGEEGEFVWYEMDGTTGPKVGT
jgi:hypothetical protein